ncbi:putative ubiquitin carboxyl-terminal hydrolase [Triangularia verruculosa]|uniref:Ubiquitin carboxyl-terminal hydrolase n=1 Tax=Triangularia verruculosa TaxID=2587418 RepID=A0AAN7ARH3_9PEZI|nr:putative ubiquitin carboxyl-terminal hydrolase [Triangularia verruculosa]
MAGALHPEESRDRAVSSEPCSTRPNPFDDSDVSSRKRRRTSLHSASRSRSLDTTSSSPSPAAGEGPAPILKSDSTMKVDSDPSVSTIPTTPEQKVIEPPSALTSRHVTINVRTPSRLPGASPDSPSSPSLRGATPTSPTNVVKLSIEDSELDMAQEDVALDTPVSSASEPSSPPVEVIPPDDDDDDFEDGGSIAILDGDEQRVIDMDSIQDPTPFFPFREDHDSWSDAVTRVATYLPNHVQVPQKLQEYIDDYLSFAENASHKRFVISYVQNQELWQCLPDIVCFMTARGFYPQQREHRSEIFEFYKWFAKLTAFFVKKDALEFEKIASGEQGIRLRDLISPVYVSALAGLVRKKGQQDNYQRPEDEFYMELQQVMDCFQGYTQTPGGTLSHVLHLARAETELIPQFPKLTDHVTSLCSLAAAIQGRFFFVYNHESPQVAPRAKLMIARGYQFFIDMSKSLATFVDKGPNHFSHENASTLLSALAETYQIALNVDGAVPQEVIADFRRSRPFLVTPHLPEAIAHLWKFNIFVRLIKSGQMQLRVMAAHAMCTDLINLYRKYHDHGEMPNMQTMRFYGEYLLQTGLVQYLLGPTCHPEIAAESHNIIGFLVVSRTYSNEHTDAWWHTVTTTQDTRISDALILMLNRIAHLFMYDGLIHLCEKLNTVPADSFTEPMRLLFLTITHNLMEKTQDHRTITDSPPYDLCTRLIRESSRFGSQSPVAHPNLQEAAIKRFRELLSHGHGPTADVRRSLMAQCLNDIAHPTWSAIGSLWVLHLLTRNQTQQSVLQLAQDNDLPRLLVEELEAAIRAAHAAGFPAVISGAYNLPRRELLGTLIKHRNGLVTKEQGLKLWQLLVGPGASCRQDRDVAWELLLSAMEQSQVENRFAAICFADYLPTLGPQFFCQGTLDFVRARVLPLVNDPGSIVLDDDDSADHAGIELLWQMILTALPDSPVANHATRTLVRDVYVESKSILSFSYYRARKVHLRLVRRCLRQLSEAATKLQTFANSGANMDDADAMDVVPSDQEVQKQQLTFVRSLCVLREFHRLHQEKPAFCAPDLQSLILDSPRKVEGESAELKYQSFDENSQTPVQPLSIGKLNTTASLLASIREVTGFNNYRMYYRGAPFVPQEDQICKSLEDLQIHNGLILVKKDAETVVSARARPGASPVDVEILGHFEELWQYLSLEEKLAREIYAFLVKLPADEGILKTIDSPTLSFQEFFPMGQAFKSLYAVHALREYIAARRKQSNTAKADADGKRGQELLQLYADSLTRAMSLVVPAISNDVAAHCPSRELRIELEMTLLDTFVLLSTEPQLPEAAAQYLDEALLLRLLTNLSSALSGYPAPHVRRCFQSILEACCLSDSFMAAFCAQSEVPRLVERMLLQEPGSPVSKKTAALIRQKCGMDESSEHRLTRTGATTAFRILFWPLVCGLIEQAVNSRSAEVLGLCLDLFRAVRSAQPELLELRSLSDQWFNLLASYETTEDVTKPHVIDQVACLLVRLLDTLISSHSGVQRKEVLPRTPGMGPVLFWKHLFNPMDDNANEIYEYGPPILTSHTRAALMSIILATLEANPGDLQEILGAMHELVMLRVNPSEDQLYQYDLPQQFEREKAVRAPCGYQGLRNLSNTCYFNSLFTQLFMNHEFRRFMLGAKIRGNRYGQALLIETQKVFAQMQDSIARSCNPEDCVASIKTYEDSQIDVGIQMDVDEFYNLLFDRWEGQFATPEEKNRFRSFYGGQLVQQVRSTECAHISERLEPFSAIQCDIKGNNSLAKSLEAYVKGEVMEGDNKYKCSTCDRHVNAVKRACLKDIPDNLIFHLKRFDFNLRTMQRSKINQHFEFPDKIDMRPYTIDHLSKPEDGDGPEDIFELVGVLVHSGTAESGHYYSYIRERPSSGEQPTWIEFNDDVVTAWNPANLEHTCFGGPDYSVQYQSNGVQFDKQYSAYMLFYQRAASLATSQQTYVEQNKLSGPLRVPVPRQLEESIYEENRILLRRHCLFDPYQIQFVVSAMIRLKAIHPACTDNHTAEGLALWMAFGHLDQVASRIKDTPHFVELAARIQSMIQNCGLCALSLNRYFGEYPESVRMMLQRNIDGEIRQGTGRLVIRTLQTIKEQLPLEYGSVSEADEEDGSEVGVSNAITITLAVISQLWMNFHINMRSWPEVFGFMLSFVRLGHEELAGFLGHGHLEALLWIVAADPNIGEQNLPTQIYKMAGIISRKPHNRMPSYESILALLDYILAHVRLTERHDRTPYARQVPDSGSTFNMTTAEAKILWMEWPKYGYNIFVDRLIMIGQNEKATHSILANLIKQSEQMEQAVCRTLRQAIIGNASHGSLVAPYLRVAGQVFLRHASDAILIRDLIRHVCQQCKGLTSAEGKAFLDFQRAAFDGLREHSGEDDEDIILAGLNNMPEWVPSLLGYYDSAVSAEVEQFLQEKLFSHRTYNVHTGDITSEDEDEGQDEDEVEVGVPEKMNQTARALGLQCLLYLRDNYVVRNADVPQHVVTGLQRVISKCSKYFDFQNPAEDKQGQDFRELSNVILEAVAKLTVVEELEEDGSDWENSSICSGKLESFGVFATNALQDVDLQ